jgi:hypothetical protein
VTADDGCRRVSPRAALTDAPLGTQARGTACRPAARVRRSGLHTPGSGRRRWRPRRKPPASYFATPDVDQIAAEVVPLCQTMQGLASDELLGDLGLERDALGSMLSCHGPSSETQHTGQLPRPDLSGPRGALHGGVSLPRRSTNSAQGPANAGNKSTSTSLPLPAAGSSWRAAPQRHTPPALEWDRAVRVAHGPAVRWGPGGPGDLNDGWARTGDTFRLLSLA